jgi:magnesium-transporting ATPase (P-type)
VGDGAGCQYRACTNCGCEHPGHFRYIYLFNSRYITASVFNRAGLTGNRYVLIAIAILIIFQLGFTCLAPVQSLFGTAAIDFSIWLRIIIVSSTVLFLVELEKYFVRHMGRYA